MGGPRLSPAGWVGDWAVGAGAGGEGGRQTSRGCPARVCAQVRPVSARPEREFRQA